MLALPMAAMVIACWIAGMASTRGDVILSEFLASNVLGELRDEDGGQSDWIQVLNRGGAAVDLSGFSLTDDAQDPRKWMFPQLVLEAGASLDPDALRAWSRERLASFKIPRSFIAVTALPRMATGKIQKHRLSELDGAAIE